MTNISQVDHAGTLVAPLPSTPVDRRERRGSARKRSNFTVRVTPLGVAAWQECHVDDISEDGLYVRAPRGAAMSVGQRCEVRFPPDVTAEGGFSLTDDTCYATVVRTEQRADEAGAGVGAGLRLDQPLFF